jgi:hypothetical protein
MCATGHYNLGERPDWQSSRPLRTLRHELLPSGLESAGSVPVAQPSEPAAWPVNASHLLAGRLNQQKCVDPLG